VVACLDPLEPLASGDPKRFGQLHDGGQPRVEVPAFDLLVVRQGPIVLAHEIHLREALGGPHFANAPAESGLEGAGRCHPERRHATEPPIP
jgi:hypothetical protein